MKKMEVSNEQWQLLRVMVKLLYPKLRVDKVYGDGMLALQCTHCQKITHIQWYELLLDHILVSISKKLEPKIWSIYYFEVLRNTFAARTGDKPRHPIETAYYIYFIPQIDVLRDSRNAPTPYKAVAKVD